MKGTDYVREARGAFERGLKIQKEPHSLEPGGV